MTEPRDPELDAFVELLRSAEPAPDTVATARARVLADTLDGSSFDKGDSVYCELSPFDGSETGDFVRTDTLTILNTPPVLTRATITNPSPREGTSKFSAGTRKFLNTSPLLWARRRA